MPRKELRQCDITPIIARYFQVATQAEEVAIQARTSQGHPSRIHDHYLDLFQYAWTSHLLDPIYFQLLNVDLDNSNISGQAKKAAGGITELLARAALSGLIQDRDPEQTYLDIDDTNGLIIHAAKAKLRSHPSRTNARRVAQVNERIEFEHDGARISRSAVLANIEITGAKNPPEKYLQKKVRNLRWATDEHPDVFSQAQVDLVIVKDCVVPKIAGIGKEPFILPHSFDQGSEFVAEFYFHYSPENYQPLSRMQPSLSEFVTQTFVEAVRIPQLLPSPASI